MHFLNSNTILTLACGVSLIPSSTALVEVTPNPGEPAAKQFVNPLIEAKRNNKSFGKPQDLTNFVESQYEAFANTKWGGIITDVVTGKIASISLKDPVLPGSGAGNRLLWTVGTYHDGHGPQGHRMLANSAASAVKDWVVANNDVIGIDPAEMGEQQTTVHAGGELIQVIIHRQFKGVPVAESQANFDVAYGNLISFGLDEWGTVPSDFNVIPSITPEEAQAAIASYAGFPQMGQITPTKPQLKIISMAKQGPPGLFSIRGGTEKFAGYTYKLVWQVGVNLAGQTIENFEGQVDAVTGEVFSFQDTNDYLMEAKGGVYPVTNDGIVPDGKEQSGWPMPFMYVGSSTTDIGGNFVSSGTAKFEGPYLKINDNCGIAGLTTNQNGLDWGTSGGTDCTTPGYGGSGNTHSSRSVFYETNTIKLMSLKRLPNNNWLKQQLSATVNINSSCNAYWSGSVNFYKSGGGCSNTGEIAAVTDHEWGHGMDANDANPGIASPSGEGIADLYAALRLGTSCIGRNFFQSETCANCKTCSGVRDIDYLKRSGSPQTFTWSNTNCGTNVHCKGYTYSEAVWSLYKRHLQSPPYNYDDYTALEIVTRLTYIGGGSVVSWYSGTPPYGGCAATSGYKKFLTADDDNGNLNDGTPHMKAIYAAFNENQIACNDLTLQDSGCAGKPTEKPIVTTVAGNRSVRLEWNAVDRAVGYEVLRSDGGVFGCGQGKFLLTGSSAGTTITDTFWEDTGLQNGREYCYLVIPKGNAISCYGRSSAATLATPLEGPDFLVSCPSQELLLRKEESQPITCTIKSIAGYSSTLSLKSSADLFLAGVTSTVDQTFVDIPPNGSVNIVVTVTSSSQVVYGAIGYVTVTADDSSKTKTSQIQVRIRNPQIAVFDQSYNSPRCDDYVYQCTSVDLSGSILNGRGNVGPEVNAPNTIDSCQDGGSGTYHSDESLDAITVKRTDGDTTKNMAVGSSVTVEAKVYCYSTGASDWGDFYYASDAANPIWTFIGSVQCPGGGERTLSRSYVLPQGGSSQVVRVNFRYSGSQSPCSGGGYDDTDDIVFAVAPANNAPTQPTPIPTSQPTPMPTKAPTPAPTKPPTRMPTRTPTKTPTRMPTRIPTKTPTPKPTKACSAITKQNTCIGTTYCTWSTTTKRCTFKTSVEGPTDLLTPTPIPTRTPTKTPTPKPTKACSSITKQTTCIGTTYCTWSTTTKKCIANMML